MTERTMRKIRRVAANGNGLCVTLDSGEAQEVVELMRELSGLRAILNPDQEQCSVCGCNERGAVMLTDVMVAGEHCERAWLCQAHLDAMMGAGTRTPRSVGLET